jgi:hypothetical protein
MMAPTSLILLRKALACLPRRGAHEHILSMARRGRRHRRGYRRGPRTTFDPGTPEASVQAYFRAIRDRDIASAFALFTTDLRARCSAEELRRASLNEPSFSVRIRGSRERDAVTEIEVRIGIGASGPFGNGYEEDRVMVLRHEDGDWRIAEPPWPLWYCPELPVRSSQRAGEVS